MNIKNLNMRWATRSVRPAAVAGLVLAALGVSGVRQRRRRAKGQASSYLIIAERLGRARRAGQAAAPFDPVLRRTSRRTARCSRTTGA